MLTDSFSEKNYRTLESMQRTEVETVSVCTGHALSQARARRAQREKPPTLPLVKNTHALG